MKRAGSTSSIPSPKRYPSITDDPLIFHLGGNALVKIVEENNECGDPTLRLRIGKYRCSNDLVEMGDGSVTLDPVDLFDIIADGRSKHNGTEIYSERLLVSMKEQEKEEDVQCVLQNVRCRGETGHELDPSFCVLNKLQYYCLTHRSDDIFSKILNIRYEEHFRFWVEKHLRSTEKFPDEASLEEDPDEASLEEGPDEASLEEGPDEASLEEGPDEASVEEKPAENSIEETPAEKSIEEGPVEKSLGKCWSIFLKVLNDDLQTWILTQKTVINQFEDQKKNFLFDVFGKERLLSLKLRDLGLKFAEKIKKKVPGMNMKFWKLRKDWMKELRELYFPILQESSESDNEKETGE